MRDVSCEFSLFEALHGGIVIVNKHTHDSICVPTVLLLMVRLTVANQQTGRKSVKRSKKNRKQKKTFRFRLRHKSKQLGFCSSKSTTKTLARTVSRNDDKSNDGSVFMRVTGTTNSWCQSRHCSTKHTQCNDTIP